MVKSGKSFVKIVLVYKYTFSFYFIEIFKPPPPGYSDSLIIW